ncbi:MAG: 50S ribosomal protein L2 [Candidatus Woesebacteria bacterium GW2011_GWA1_45_8]|uniref:50S ribosomal protein L2 n=1 Tax=Candidatus Woesebacteria bacterium GW2011_GWA1_45_8 TaxID=1618559 RepID=A0A0G1MVV1_9BACT|nr:MAG: 50S ribosomal protein L2 [Candidatus Woesebacteria bacterium GW2011_GWA1_45_8]
MKSLIRILPKKAGRAGGRVTVRHQGGRVKRYLREIDFGRDKEGIGGKVEAIVYDPNRKAEIAMIIYEDGERRYILAPNELKVGQKVVSGAAAPVEVGNALPLIKIPVGTMIHNIEVRPGKGGQIVKSAGSAAVLHGKEEAWVLVKLPSGEIRRFKPNSLATIGQVGRLEARSERVGKAGTKRRMGIRPTVRGVAMHPHGHPHGGGEGRSHVGLKYQKTVYGKPAVGNTRRKRKYSDKLIVQRRRLGKHH